MFESSAPRGPGIWTRFSIGDAQIAIKLGPPSDRGTNTFAFSQSPFVLPTTSRREPALAKINFWTSENIVARLTNPHHVAEGLSRGLPTHKRFVKSMFKVSSDAIEEQQVLTWEHLE